MTGARHKASSASSSFAAAAIACLWCTSALERERAKLNESREPTLDLDDESNDEDDGKDDEEEEEDCWLGPPPMAELFREEEAVAKGAAALRTDVRTRAGTVERRVCDEM